MQNLSRTLYLLNGVDLKKEFMEEASGESPVNDRKVIRSKGHLASNRKKKKRKGHSKGHGPVRPRTRVLSDDRKSLYLDIYWQGKRSYEF